MRRVQAAAGSILFLALAPGVVAGLVPWLLTRWHSAGAPAWLQALGWISVAAGAAVLLEAFCRFVAEGVGTPAPAAPTEKLVVSGFYRYVRNPMYLAVASVILGQAALLGRWLLLDVHDNPWAESRLRLGEATEARRATPFAVEA